MYEDHRTSKFGLDKIVMLALLLAGLLIAQILIKAKSKINFLPPIELEHSGLAIPMPVGNGWQTKSDWKFEKNAFYIASAFIPRSGRPHAIAECQYSVAAEKLSPEEIIKQKAIELKGEIIKTGQIKNDSVTINYAHIEDKKTGNSAFFGYCILPDNRQLEIQAHQASDSDISEKVFFHIAENLKYQDNGSLSAGREIVEKLKNGNLSKSLTGQNLFLIRDSQNRPAGFSIEQIKNIPRNAPMVINGSNFLHLRGIFAQQSISIFQSDSTLSQFNWKSQGVDNKKIQINFDESGTMTVAELGPAEAQSTYYPSNQALPDIFLQQALMQMIDANSQAATIDFIEDSGKITPTLISRVEPQKEAEYVFQLDSMDKSQPRQMVYLDENKTVTKMLFPDREIFLERATAKEVIAVFPEYADLIMQKKNVSPDDLI